MENKAQKSNDLVDLTDDRVDSLSALITVSAEQLQDRLRAGEALSSGSARSAELIEAVFGGSPSVESYLASRSGELQAA